MLIFNDGAFVVGAHHACQLTELRSNGDVSEINCAIPTGKYSQSVACTPANRPSYVHLRFSNHLAVQITSAGARFRPVLKEP